MSLFLGDILLLVMSFHITCLLNYMKSGGVLQERSLHDLGGCSFKELLRIVGATVLSPALQGHYNVTGGNRSRLGKAAFLDLA